MQYKNTRTGYNNYRIRKSYMKKIRTIKRNAIVLGSIIITFGSISYFKNNNLKNSTNITLEDISKYECCDINPLEISKAGFNTNNLLNNDEFIIYSNKMSNDEVVMDNQKLSIREMFIKYCNIYNVDANIVYQKASSLTNNFTSDDYINNNRIIGTTVCGKERKFDNIESGIICFIRHIKQIPEDFDLGVDNIKIKNNYISYGNCENLVSDYCNIFGGIEKELCMSIIYSENSRDLSGKQITENYNPGCLRNSESKMACYENIEQGLIEMILNLRYRYIEDMNLENYNYNDLINTIQCFYAPIDDPDNANLKINENWAYNVKDIYLELKDDYYSIYNERTGLNR